MKVWKAASSLCQFGLAQADITPPVGIYHRMWGAATHDRSEGVHRPLLASVMIFRQREALPSPATQQVVIALDHCLLDAQEIERLGSAVAAATGITRESLAVTFSHTHAAGLMSRERTELPGGELIPPYLDGLYATLGQLAQQALRAMRDVTITYGYGHCALAAHRDYWDEERAIWVCGFNPDQAADDTVLVGRVTDDHDRWVATLVNYACHPTTLAWDNRLISPDYPGAMRETIQRETGAPCVFLQGASGDLGPRVGYVGDPQLADRNGRQLAYAALAVLEGLPPARHEYHYRGPVVSGATIGAWEFARVSTTAQTMASSWSIKRHELPLRYRAELPQASAVEAERERLLVAEAAAQAQNDVASQRELRAFIERQTRLLARIKSLPSGDVYPYEILVWRLGDAVWVAVQGEPYNSLQRNLRQRFPDTPIIVTVLMNSWGASYLPPRELYNTGIYQETIAVLEAGSLERVTAAAIDLVATGVSE